MSKASAPQKFGSAGLAVAVTVLAALAIALVFGLHRKNETAIGKRGTLRSTGPAAKTEQRGRVRASTQALPLAFEANQGQTDHQVKYLARGNGYTVFLTDNDTVFALHSSASGRPTLKSAANGSTRLGGKAGRSDDAVRADADANTDANTDKDRSATIQMHLVDANRQSLIVAEDKLPGHSNYFIGNDRRQWHANVPQYGRVSYREAYPGVTLAFYGVQKKLEFDFIVAPGARPEPIRFEVGGTIRIVTDPSGNLILASTAGDVMLHKPVAYQQKDGSRQPVDARFVLRSRNQVSFELGSYDHSRELVIDPSVSYATYLGGTAEDDGFGIAVDSSGNAYVTGQTASTNFPGTTASTYGGGFDVFVTKVSADGSSLEYSTYVGGSGNDSGNAIAVDASGDAYVAGGTASSNFPVTSSAFQKTAGGVSGGLDAFVFELASSGGSLTYSTYLGGSSVDYALGIALATDGSGDTFVVGLTGSTNFPGTTTSPIQHTLISTSDGFVTKLNASGSALLYSTYLGGSSGDYASSVAVDSSNNAYVTGATQNPSFPTTTGVFQATCGTAANCNGGIYDAFVSVVKADGSGFVYSTFLGGTGDDQGLGIAVDSASNAYVTGLTQSSDFPTKNPIQSKFGGVQDAFVTALNPAGSALLYSTYLGGSEADAAAGIAVDGNKNVYVTGQTASSDFPLTSNATQPKLGGGNDAFIAEINPAGSQLMISTYLGGSQDEDSASTGPSFSPVGAIAVDSAGANLYVTGNTASPTGSFPATTGAYQTSFGGGSFDAFVAKYSLASFTLATGALSPASGSPGVSATATVTVTSVLGFSSPVTLACSVAPVVPKAPTCSFTPSTPITPAANATATATLNLATTASTAMLERPSNRHSSGIAYALLMPIAGITLLGAGFGSGGRRRKKLFGFLMLGMLLFSLILMPACSSSSSGGGGGGGGTDNGTPTGPYTITVTGTSGSNVATASLTLTVE